MRSRPFLLVLTLVIISGCQRDVQTPEEATAAPYVPVLTQQWMLDSGLDRPESVIFDAARDVLYITNLVGEGDGMDGIGYIAKVSTAGEMVDQDWITGLNAPKGIALAGDRLYASDINSLVEIDLDAGAIANKYTIEGDAYLNDVTVHPDGAVYVTDSRYSKIYKLENGEFSLWLESDQIQMPNGIHVIGDELVAAAGDSSAENPGQARYFQAISLNDKSIRSIESAAPDGALDAVEPDGKGGIFTTDWLSGRLMYFKEGEGTTLLQQLGQGSADVDYIATSNMLYVPVMQEGQLIAYKVD